MVDTSYYILTILMFVAELAGLARTQRDYTAGPRCNLLSLGWSGALPLPVALLRRTNFTLPDRSTFQTVFVLK